MFPKKWHDYGGHSASEGNVGPDAPKCEGTNSTLHSCDCKGAGSILKGRVWPQQPPE
jgi:hypothetical protein